MSYYALLLLFNSDRRSKQIPLPRELRNFLDLFIETELSSAKNDRALDQYRWLNESMLLADIRQAFSLWRDRYRKRRQRQRRQACSLLH